MCVYIIDVLNQRRTAVNLVFVELRSIEVFVVGNFFENNHLLSPNFEHKLPIMYEILAANFFAILSAFPVLLWPPVS